MKDRGEAKFGGIFVGMLAAILVLGEMGWGQSQSAGQIVPKDTVLLVTMRNVDGLVEDFKRTPFYGLYKDPAMQPFMVRAEKEVRKRVEEFVRETWKALGCGSVRRRNCLGLVGRVIFALRLGTRMILRPDYSVLSEMSEADGPIDFDNLPKREFPEPFPEVVVLAEMGDRMEAMRSLVSQLSMRAVENGAIRRSEDVRGVEVQIVGGQRDGDDVDSGGFVGGDVLWFFGS